MVISRGDLLVHRRSFVCSHSLDTRKRSADMCGPDGGRKAKMCSLLMMQEAKSKGGGVDTKKRIPPSSDFLLTPIYAFMCHRGIFFLFVECIG